MHCTICVYYGRHRIIIFEPETERLSRSTFGEIDPGPPGIHYRVHYNAGELQCTMPFHRFLRVSVILRR